MTKVLLINQEKVPHYRIPIYNYLSGYLGRERYDLTIVSEGTEEGSAYRVDFDHRVTPLSFIRLARLILELDPDVVIYWVRLRYLYLFPMLLFLKLLGKKAVYWGHGTDLAGGKAMRLKVFANSIEYRISDALILYGEHLKKNVPCSVHGKTFIANNTLHFNGYVPGSADKRACLSKYGITTSKNIICMGRMQKRKRLDHLVRAFESLHDPDTGLIFVGPDTDGVLEHVGGRNIYRLDPIYGQARLDLLSATDVFCLPGAVGLSIVDAFYCGLPIVTEDGDMSPEIMYLKDGVNGFVVSRGDVRQLTERLRQLLEDRALRDRFSLAAKKEIRTAGHIDRMCEGFSNALRCVCQKGYDGVPAGEAARRDEG
jgi:glycosyltransferase involved in cell wall biosynthesis